ncbi:hypothetical protein Tco_0877997 [Tanacetum coccineum]|uniref:Transposase MuDR plant domain-containing protein n=1 Tax=Tanacetum coccineum TaxID=301880 RepID=A0ABQ5BZF0_9ASTR
MYYHFLIPRLGLDYGMHPLNVDADVLEMAKYVKDYKIILVYVERESSIFVTPKKGVSIAVDNHLRKCPIEIDSSPDVNMNLTPMCHRNLTKEWEHPSSYVEAPIVVECADDPFEDLDEILGRIESFKEVEVDADNESEKESDTEADYTSGSNSEDSDYDPEQDEVFDDDEHIVEDVHGKGKKVNKQKKVDKYSCPWTMLVAYTNKGRWEVRTLIEDQNCLQSREIKACASRFLSDHIIKSPTTNHDIHVRAVQDQISKEQYSQLREYAHELINQNPGKTIRIDVQQELLP